MESFGTGGDELPGGLGRHGKPLKTRGTSSEELAPPPLLPRCVLSGNPLILRVDVLERREWIGT